MSSPVDEKLEDVFYYDDTSPTFLRWNSDRFAGAAYKSKMASKGDVAGTVCRRSGYAKARFNGVSKSLHRIVWKLHYGEIPKGLMIDHIDGDKLNNNIDNLRLVSKVMNDRNRIKLKRNKSGVTGVTLHKNSKGILERFTATWYKDGKVLTKSFSINKYGEELAFFMACEYREQMINLLNLQGAGYTERHGK